MDVLLFALLFNSLQGAEGGLDSLDLLHETGLLLLLDVYFELKLVLLENLALDLTGDLPLCFTSLFYLLQRLSCACLDIL